MDITSRYFFFAASKKARIQDEAKIAMDHMVNNFIQAYEIYDFASRDADPYTIGVRLDIDSGTRLPNNTPGNCGDDTWIVYRYITGEIWYYDDAGSAGLPPDPPAGGWANWLGTSYEVITTDILVSAGISMFVVADNRIDIDITTQDVDGEFSTNLQTSVVARSLSAT